jgi:phenylpropionate dioxygenase-like ring-hydroxylating dioxygenase large terminal subunit
MSAPSLTRFFHPVLPSRQLGKGPKLVVLNGERFALWRDANGKPCAVADACPHRNAPLSLGRVKSDGRLACNYHGWSFDGRGAGACPSQPTLKCKTRAYQVVERERYLWLGDESASERPFPLPTFDGFTLAAAFPSLFEAPIHITLDNFTEDEHFPTVHAAFGWEEKDWPKVRYEAKTNEADRTEATYIGPQRPSPLLPLIGVKAGDDFHNHFESRFDPVCHVYSSHWEDPVSGTRRPVEAQTVVYMMPVNATTTRYATFVYVKIDPSSGFRRVAPMINVLAHAFVRTEWWMDARWVRHLAHTAKDLRGLRLGKFDKTLIKNRKLLKTIYFGETEHASETISHDATAE